MTKMPRRRWGSGHYLQKVVGSDRRTRVALAAEARALMRRVLFIGDAISADTFDDKQERQC